ncbi:MAG TPA: hypothetical protein VGF39_09570 [Stellaceae bacterium]|jgi:hypothetical protein
MTADDERVKVRKQACLAYWREAYPFEPDPSDVDLHLFMVAQERKVFLEQWRKAHPGRVPPDDYAIVRQWAVDENNRRALAHLRRTKRVTWQ